MADTPVQVRGGHQARDQPPPSEEGKDMDKNPRFLVGEPVERTFDGLVGIVREVSTFQGDFSYKVDFGREPMEGHTDDLWWGTEVAWRSARRTHAHVVQRSRDCDGDYEHTYVMRPSALERTEEMGDLDFKERVMGCFVSFHVVGTLSVVPEGMTWEQQTEEGYVHSEATWCDDVDCGDRTTQRDFRAESMGY